MRHPPRRNVGLCLLLGVLAGCGTAPAIGGKHEPDQPSGNAPAATETDAGSGPAGHEARLALCADQVEGMDGASHDSLYLGTHQGVDVFQVTAGDEPRVVAVGRIRPGGRDACAVLPPLAGQEPVTGRFWPGAGTVEAVLLGPERCDPEWCPAAVLIRESDRPLGALFLPGKCDEAVLLGELGWFATLDSLQLTCRQSAGAGYRETLLILHVTGQGLAPVLALETGTGEHASLGERETPGFCERRPVGSVELVERGERPVVRVLDPARGEPGIDGKGTALVADFQYDPAQGRFAQITPGTLVDYDARAWCKQGRAPL